MRGIWLPFAVQRSYLRYPGVARRQDFLSLMYGLAVGGSMVAGSTPTLPRRAAGEEDAIVEAAHDLVLFLHAPGVKS
jgi:hypothetical protein